MAIQYCFDVDDNLQTHLYTKETDSILYFYGSCHPNHVYSSIVYSQCLHLRRIINDGPRLAQRIDELKTCFYNSNYPKGMVENTSSKVKSMERSLTQPRDASKTDKLVPLSPTKEQIRAISS